MKHLYTFMLLLLSTAAAYAQPDRLIAVTNHQDFSLQGNFTPKDSFVFLYNLGNMQTGTIDDYYGDSMRCDEMMHFSNYAVWGYYKYRQHYYIYNSNGDIMKETVMQLGSNSVLENKNMYYYSYNSAGNHLTDKYSFEWKNNTWDSTERTTNKYDANGNLLLAETWATTVPNGLWQGSARDSFAYDAQGHLICHAWFYWNASLFEFRPGLRYLYTYNAQGQVDTQQYQTYSGGWKNQEMDIYSYNAQGLVDSQLHRAYMGFPVQWQDHILQVFAYNSALQQELVKVYFANGAVWTPNLEKYTAYDAQGAMLYHDEIDVNPTTPHAGVLNRDSVETLSANPRVIREVHKVHTGLQLRNQSMVERRADAANRWISWTQYNWDTVQHSWVGGPLKTTFTYGQGLHVGNVATARQLSVFPNPATGFVIAEAPVANGQAGTAAICDLQGRLVQQQHIPAGTPRLVLPTAHLGSGTYILSITSAGETAAARFVVE